MDEIASMPDRDPFSAFGGQAAWMARFPAHRPYSIRCERNGRCILFALAGMQASASVTATGLIRVTYESAPHERVDELCPPEPAVSLLSAIMNRRTLHRISLADIGVGTIEDFAPDSTIHDGIDSPKAP